MFLCVCVGGGGGGGGSFFITETGLFKYTENFTPKNENFQMKNSDIFHISALNIDCGYSLEPRF